MLLCYQRHLQSVSGPNAILLHIQYEMTLHFKPEVADQEQTYSNSNQPIGGMYTKADRQSPQHFWLHHTSLYRKYIM